MTVVDLIKEMEGNTPLTDAIETYNNTVAYHKRKKEKNVLTEATAFFRVIQAMERRDLIKII